MVKLVGDYKQGMELIAVGEHSVKFSPTNALLVAQLDPQYAWLASRNRINAAGTAAGTAIAPLATEPAATAAWALYNPVSSGRNYYPINISCHSVSGTLGLGMGLMACVAESVQSAAVADYASSDKGSLCGAQMDSAATFGQNVTLATTPTWVTVASRDQVSAVSVGSGLSARVDGMFRIPPGFAMGITVHAPTGTSALFAVQVVWAEY